MSLSSRHSPLSVPAPALAVMSLLDGWEVLDLLISSLDVCLSGLLLAFGVCFVWLPH